MAQVKQALGDMNATQVVDYTGRVVSGMTGNADFPTPNPPLATLSGLAAEIRDEQLNTLDLINQTNTSRTRVADLTTQIKSGLGAEGNYVQGVADTKTVETEAVAVIEGANMKARDDAKPIGALEAPAKVSLVDAHEDGALDAHCSKVHGAYSYLWQTCVGDSPITGAWGNDQVTPRTSIILHGFALGSRVWMRVAGVGADDTRNWSAPISDIVT